MATLGPQKLIYSRETICRESRLESSGAGVSFRPLLVTDLPSPAPPSRWCCQLRIRQSKHKPAGDTANPNITEGENQTGLSEHAQGPGRATFS